MHRNVISVASAIIAASAMTGVAATAFAQATPFGQEPVAAERADETTTETTVQNPFADPQGEPGEETGEEEELSELELLSRTDDDPFAGAVEVRDREPESVTLRALDKITARYTDIEIEMNQIATFGSLEIQPRTCDKRPPEEFPETTAFLEIFDTKLGEQTSNFKSQSVEIIEDDIAPTEVAPLDVTGSVKSAFDEPAADETASTIVSEFGDPHTEFVLEGPTASGVNIFRGWMFASSPALNALEHPVYDVWVIDCKTRSTEG